MASPSTLYLYLVVIVLARQRGASPQLIMFAFLGLGGVLDAVASPRITVALRTPLLFIGALGAIAALLPLLIVIPGRLSPGLVYGGMFALFPAWSALVGSYQLRITPAELQGRVQSVTTLFALGPTAFGYLVVGFMLQNLGTTPTVLALCGVMVVVASYAVRGPLPEDYPEQPDHSRPVL